MAENFERQELSEQAEPDREHDRAGATDNGELGLDVCAVGGGLLRCHSLGRVGQSNLAWPVTMTAACVLTGYRGSR